VKAKLFILYLLSCTLILTGICQPPAYKYVYYFDKDLQSCARANSVITGKGFKEENGLLKLDYFITESGVLLMSVHFTDTTLSTLQGVFQSYYINAVLEKEGSYNLGMMQGLWQQWDNKGLKTDSMIYDKDYKVKYAAFYHHLKGKKLATYKFTDSLQNTFVEKNYSEKGDIFREVNFIGQRGLLKNYDSSGVTMDSVFTREVIEASFPGNWNDYLRKNLNADILNEKAATGIYTVVVAFVVTKDGNLTDIRLEEPLGNKADAEAIRVIKKSPRWKPAKQYGSYVSAYRRQPITFIVQY